MKVQKNIVIGLGGCKRDDGNSRKVMRSIVAHAELIGLKPNAALHRAWWFYLAAYEKIVNKKG